MYISATILSFLALTTSTMASPVPTAETPESATVVDVTSASYSSLIVFNPAAAPTSSGSDTFLTPSGVSLPQASATLSLQADLPSASTLGLASESAHVRVVGQGNSTSTSKDEGQAVKANSGIMIGVSGLLGIVGCGSALLVGSGFI